MYAIELLSFGNGTDIHCIYLLVKYYRGFKSDCVGLRPLTVHSLRSRRYSRARENGKIEILQQTLYVWTQAK